MGLHPSLKVDSASTQQRTVLTRIERIKDMMKKGLWVEGREVIGLPKTKILKIKAKKTVKAKDEAAEGAAAPAAGAPAAAAAAKPGAAAKPAAKPAGKA